jgi:hypothetical protein
MGRSRAFAETDIPQVARLHNAVFTPRERRARDGRDARHAYFKNVFLDNPWRDPALTSLVYEEADGRISGFLGVVPRRMSMRGQQLVAAISTQFIIAPDARNTLAAVQLARTFLEGPQDLSITDEANDAARKIWEGLGGTTALLQSIHWTRPVRPARFALSFARKRRALAPLAAVAGPLSRIVDVLATRVPCSHLFQSRPPVLADALRLDTVLAAIQECTGGSLRVEYDHRAFCWLLERAAVRRPDAALHTVLIRNQELSVIGWYLYSLHPNGVADVLQIAAKPGAVDLVLDHLFYGAWRQGATAVTGRVEPRFLQALSDKYCLFHRRGPWMLVSAKKREVVQAFAVGDVFFSRFDGEWCLGF